MELSEKEWVPAPEIKNGTNFDYFFVLERGCMRTKSILEEITKLQEVTAILRGENGCPWDKEQDHQTLVPYLIEESQEVIEAILKKDDDLLKEELGDLLFQVVFHARLAEERRSFDLGDIAKRVSDKLIFRHPHVFKPEELTLSTSQEVLENWEKIKDKEKKNPKDSSIFSNIPENFSSLLKAEKYQKKAAKVGFDWNDISDVQKKVKEEMEEFLTELNRSKDNQVRIEEEFGDLLFSLVNFGRHLGISSESALTKANAKFKKRFQYIEKVLQERGKNPNTSDLKEMDRLWNEAKELEK
ncbi:nucleoside triphosphate pyrophosphohydrolase [Leptospira interrogans]|uniref:nucleoside triphosphate pyrophosphohydrolase n=1 Tax=Leptospira interrogans TaxID=173 RepID=UPI00037A2585|nr:nucleoside triphosphate pyrophosphohydrolase [Leptospira interrogans]KAA1268895.1 nucleoside triphosphate pyrophosphohydrolase [Leptospira interrogans serovar Weerasinghe]QCO31727.1 nucleoside triphosphate pyrophosphohydrolase [Leptospira interrogans]QCO42459.1 nucleoside triphosphate pyrophosphohydrolase [Leptospira interrogans]ULG81171.1 nucleoside triphosphate pyrophosphohydrolase [Leptospira interrogans]ULG91607.1 nucleoside triphosphate pyrophosphohydrolase [Leptospira interrogans]